MPLEEPVIMLNLLKYLEKAKIGYGVDGLTGKEAYQVYGKKFAKFQISKQEGKESSQVKDKAKEFAKEIKAEIEAKESSGLMTKETK